ncbi:sulfatase-like hydrolase/transferase [Plantactinospora sp. B24E8]|uniref:sulfatase-like hydrolase/transferase n=1 Tax=Plantactinospora sp. B24E8 TaxID=3153567 RepID=UPI00325EADF0
MADLGWSGPAVEVRPGSGGRRAELWRLAEVAALCGLVVTQPMLDITGRSPDFFLFHGADPGDILLLVALVTFGPPLLLWAVGALLGMLAGRLLGMLAGRLLGMLAGRLSRAFVGRRAGATSVRATLHTGTLGLLLAALAVQAGKHLTGVRGWPLLVTALLVGALGGYAYRRWSVTGQLLRVATAGPLVFVLLFVLASPASAVVLPAGRGAGGPVGVAGVDHPPVVMLVLDEFPLVSLLDERGALDARRFPNFARLAGESTWYRNASAVSGFTPYALPAMLTGRYPTGAQAPHHARHPGNLFTAFGGAYQIEAQESISQLCPPRLCPERVGADRGGLPALLRESGALLGQIVSPWEAGRRDPEHAYQEPTRREAGRDTGDKAAPTDPRFRWGALDVNQPARFADFLAALRPADRPTLHFLHLLLPHSPWNYLPSGIKYEAAPGMPNDGAGWVELAHRRHLLQVEYTDRLLGETLRRLESTGLYDRALVVVTADHGVSFTRGAQGRGLAAVQRAPGEMLWVPLFVKRPGQRTGVVDDRHWEHVDLLPTVADLAGVPVRWPVDGVSALRTRRPDGDRRYHDQPDRPMSVPGSTFADVVSGRARPVLPDPPRPELVGRAVAGFPVGPPAGTVSLDNRAEFDRIDPDGGRLPVLVSGSVPASVPDGTLLAVAVNGRIGAVTPVLRPDRKGHRFAALMPDESLFVPGRNRLDVYQLADGSVLRPLRG